MYQVEQIQVLSLVVYIDLKLSLICWFGEYYEGIFV